MRITEHPILDFERGPEITIYFEGRALRAYEGETIAAALHAAGIKVLSYSHRLGRPRGFFCAVGNCASCLVEVDGEANVRACITPVRDGMRISRQRGKGDLRVGT